MAELALFLGSLGVVGYFLNRDGKMPRQTKTLSVNDASYKPTEQNVLPIQPNNRSVEIQNQELQKMTDRYLSSYQFPNSNILPPSPYSRGGNADTFGTNELPADKYAQQAIRSGHAGAYEQIQDEAIAIEAGTLPFGDLNLNLDVARPSLHSLQGSFLSEPYSGITEPFSAGGNGIPNSQQPGLSTGSSPYIPSSASNKQSLTGTAATLAAMQATADTAAQNGGIVWGDGSATGSYSTPFHNNMIPFVGSKMTQNTDPDANKNTLEDFTGTGIGSTVGGYKQKVEAPALFAPSSQLGNVFGNAEIDHDSSLASAQSSMAGIYGRMANVGPSERQYVGPGINVGPDVPSTGGFHQFTRLLPSNVDDYKCNSFEDRVASCGSAYVQKPEQVGYMNQNGPARVFRYDYWNTAPTGQPPSGIHYNAPTNTAGYGNGDVRCKDPPIVPYAGSAGGREGFGQTNRAEYQAQQRSVAQKNQCYQAGYQSSCPYNGIASGGGNCSGGNAPGGYVNGNYVVLDQNRDDTGTREFNELSNVHSYVPAVGDCPSQWGARQTQRQSTMAAYSGNPTLNDSGIGQPTSEYMYQQAECNDKRDFRDSCLAGPCCSWGYTPGAGNCNFTNEPHCAMPNVNTYKTSHSFRPNPINEQASIQRYIPMQNYMYNPNRDIANGCRQADRLDGNILSTLASNPYAGPMLKSIIQPVACGPCQDCC